MQRIKEQELTKKKMGKEFNECLLEMAQANFTAGDLGNIVKD